MILKFAGATLQRSLHLSPQFSWASVELPSRLHQISLPKSPDYLTQPLTPDRDPVKHYREIVTRDGIDPKLPEMVAFLNRLQAQSYPHEVGSFDAHLIGTWRILACWQRPLPILRCGLFHSVYSTDTYPMALIPFSQRAELLALIGNEAEALVLLFCTLDRRRLRHQILEQGRIPDTGLEVVNWTTQERLHLSPQLIATYLVVEVANLAEQTCALFKKPGIWMSYASQLLGMIGDWLMPPPIFDTCTQQLQLQEECRARALYLKSFQPDRRKHLAIERLMETSRANPWIAEPYLDLALLMHQNRDFEQAIAYSQQALQCLLYWGTSWDKRRSWKGMVEQCLRILCENSVASPLTNHKNVISYF